MKFFGVIEADKNSRFMLGMPILGLGVMSDGRFCMGHITGDLMDLATLGHISFGYKNGFKEWIDEMELKFPKDSFPKNYEIKVCTHKEACQRALELYDDVREVKSRGGPVIKYDLTLIKNKLRKVIESE